MDISWRLLLSVLQLVIAIACWFYGPIQFQDRLMRARHLPPGNTARYFQDNVEFLDRMSPPPIERFLDVTNLPAYGLANELRDLIYRFRVPGLGWEYSWQLGEPPRAIEYIIGIREVAFLAGVILLWYWVGAQIDRFIRERRGTAKPKEKIWRITEMVIVFGMAVPLLVVCLLCIQAPKCLPPNRQIATFGLIWPAAFLTYFSFNLWKEFRGGRNVHPTGPIFQDQSG
jgi:hypothetical protein